MWYVYILKSKVKNWYYVGSTNDLIRRSGQHNSKKVSSTKHHTPLEIVWTKQFKNEIDCRNYERFIKDKRIEKERIIREEVN